MRQDTCHGGREAREFHCRSAAGFCFEQSGTCWLYLSNIGEYLAPDAVIVPRSWHRASTYSPYKVQICSVVGIFSGSPPPDSQQNWLSFVICRTPINTWQTLTIQHMALRQRGQCRWCQLRLRMLHKKSSGHRLLGRIWSVQHLRWPPTSVFG